MKMKKYILVILVAIVGITTAQAANKDTSVKGIVYENNNSEEVKPLSMAYVYVDNTIYCTYTNNDGSFELDLPKGHYEIKVAFKGFEPISQVIDVKNSKPIQLELTLIPENESLAKN